MLRFSRPAMAPAITQQSLSGHVGQLNITTGQHLPHWIQLLGSILALHYRMSLNSTLQKTQSPCVPEAVHCRLVTSQTPTTRQIHARALGPQPTTPRGDCLTGLHCVLRTQQPYLDLMHHAAAQCSVAATALGSSRSSAL